MLESEKGAVNILTDVNEEGARKDSSRGEQQPQRVVYRLGGLGSLI